MKHEDTAVSVVADSLTSGEDDQGAEEGVLVGLHLQVPEERAAGDDVLVQLLELGEEVPDLVSLLVRVAEPPATTSAQQ